MEQIIVRNLPEGTKAALRARARRHGRALEAEARLILAGAAGDPVESIVDLVGSDEGADIEFEPGRLGLSLPPADL